MSGASSIRCNNKLYLKESNAKNLGFFLAGALFLVLILSFVSASCPMMSLGSKGSGQGMMGAKYEI